eukprot:CAMPEP_0174918568 /NCGR_PEP_ID=MMETSP1355-20121228/3148_1 /TAXON_ID=464990 /ORGANISM="Hemiselmis tepida, Strain CCMP443" /LENGTH=412 /DNA_ID=CAMNT_0016163747 /DNA_START=167 /DNA_END=1401 /DNA_ORIENTATION=-
MSGRIWRSVLPALRAGGAQRLARVSRTAAEGARRAHTGPQGGSPMEWRFPSRGFSGGSTPDDLSEATPEDLKKIISDLQARLSRAESAAAAAGAPAPFEQTLSPEHIQKATKGEVHDERKKKCVTIVELQKMRDAGTPIAMATAYDFPSAVHVDNAGVDVVLVGDSVGMVVLGYDTTLPVTFDEILHHCKAVSRGCRRPLLVGDMPFGSYEVSTAEAQRNAYRLLKEGGMEAIKLEGADPARLHTAEVLVKGGIAVMGHIGLTPQSYSTLGGFRAQGRHSKAAVELVESARRLEGAGCFATVVECVPDEVAHALTEAVSIPTIGIGAGQHTSGQVLVYHDLLGMMQHPHHAKVTPKFCKQYSAVGATINAALTQYVDEVRAREFPGAAYSPYKMAKGELEAFRAKVWGAGAG